MPRAYPSEVLEELFGRVWEALEDQDKVDATGSASYNRVFQEWLAGPAMRHVREFILKRADSQDPPEPHYLG